MDWTPSQVEIVLPSGFSVPFAAIPSKRLVARPPSAAADRRYPPITIAVDPAAGKRPATATASGGRQMGPLQGVKVIELASLAPAPFGCMILGDLGAEVLRVDRAERCGPDARPPLDPLVRG